MIWTKKLQKNITDEKALAERFPLSDGEQERVREEIARFPMSIPEYYLSLIDWTDRQDPIRRMAVPRLDPGREEGLEDTSGERSNTVCRGVQHKYRQTALILVSSDCAMFCRHCFRRRFVGKEKEEIADSPEEAMHYLTEHPEINNCLLSGGDALIQSNERIREWLDSLSRLEQLDFIRIGSRVPVTFPERISGDRELIRILRGAQRRKQLYLITQFNHPREFTAEALWAVRLLQRQGIVVKNQTVLLRGVNDDPGVLGELLRRVTGAGIVQHYIFQCRPVTGAQNYFQVPLLEGERIVQEANRQQNGLGKSAEYVMSHPSGKIAILGRGGDGCMLFQYKQAKNTELTGTVFSVSVGKDTCWLKEEEPAREVRQMV